MMMMMRMIMVAVMRITFLCNQAFGPTMRPVGPCWLPWPEPLPVSAIINIIIIIIIIVIITIITIIIIILITIIIMILTVVG